MNIDEILITVEEEMLSVIKKMDVAVEERLSADKISTKQFLLLSSSVRLYAEAGRNIIEVLQSI